MPLLGGLFTRTAGKQSSTSSSITTSPPDGSSLSLSSPTATSASSPTAEYVSFMAAGPSSPNGHGLAYAGEPPKRRPMGFFGRKKSGPTAVQPDSPNPRPAYLSRLSTASERPPLTLMTTSASSPTDGTLRPPPHMYNHSTRSLPPTRPSPSATTLGSPLAPSVSPTSTRTAPKSRTQGKAAGKRFAFWGRGGAKDASPVPKQAETGPGGGEDGDFNLRAFRHVAPSPSLAPRASPDGSPSPAPRSSSLQQNQHQNTSKTRLTASALSALGTNDMRPPPRPRAPSDVSASSSRISVAAFREMQARRSAAGSPALGGPAPTRDPDREKERTANVVRTTGTGPRDKRSGSRSESGHGVYSAAPAHVRTNRTPAASTSHPHLPLSASASAPRPPPKTKPPTPTDDDESDDSEEEEGESDSDNAPLAMLARRPGAGSQAGSSGSLPLPARKGSPAISPSLPPASTSQNHTPYQQSHLARQTSPPVRSASPTSMSSSSSRPSNLRPKPKPLIDIAVLTASRPQAVSQQQRDAGFTGGGMLASFGATSSSASAAKMENVKDAESPILTSRSPPPTLGKTGTRAVGMMHFPTPPGSPVTEVPPPVLKEKKVEGRTAPVRSSSTGLVEMENERAGAASPGPRRDLLSERLRAVTGVVQPSKEASPQKSTPPPAFTTVAQQKAFHRRSSSDIVSPSKWGSPSVPAAAPPGTATADEELDLSDLADLLGGGLALVSRTGESSPPRVASGEDVTKATVEERNDSTSNTENIAPVVIRQRAPPAAFSVTSRPAQHERQRSTTMVPAGSAAAEKAAASFNATNRSFSATVVPSPSPTTAPTLKAPPSQARPAKSSPPTEGTRSSSYSDLGISARQRSSTLIPNPALSSSRSDARTATSSSSNDDSAPSSSGSSSAASRARPRSSTMMTLAPASAAAQPSRLAAPLTQAPARPFMAARKSPASSTGESSSSPAPLTPRDGSSDLSRDSGLKEKDERRVAWSGGVSGLVPSARRAHQRRSVSFDFDEEVPSDGKGKIKARPRETPIQEEERRRERRRGEAKAAIELGNVINGPGPTADDDDEDDDDVPVAQRAMPGMPMGNMPMGMNMPMPMGFATPGGMSPGWPGMLSPAQFMVPPPADPSFYAAHQQAMMIAKQAYQMAVAQQAMQQAGEEWERGSTMGFGDRSSVFGGSTTGPAMSQYGMGMGMQQGGWTPGGMSLFPPAPRSMYGGGGARSEYGGGGGGGARSEYGGGGGWNSSRSVYGENFGPSPRSSNSPAATRNPNTRVDSGYFAGAPVPKSPNPTGATPRQRTASQPATPSRGPAKRQPPSSWKASP